MDHQSKPGGLYREGPTSPGIHLDGAARREPGLTQNKDCSNQGAIVSSSSRLVVNRKVRERGHAAGY